MSKTPRRAQVALTQANLDRLALAVGLLCDALKRLEWNDPGGSTYRRRRAEDLVIELEMEPDQRDAVRR